MSQRECNGVVTRDAVSISLSLLRWVLFGSRWHTDSGQHLDVIATTWRRIRWRRHTLNRNFSTTHTHVVSSDSQKKQIYTNVSQYPTATQYWSSNLNNKIHKWQYSNKNHTRMTHSILSSGIVDMARIVSQLTSSSFWPDIDNERYTTDDVIAGIQ